MKGGREEGRKGEGGRQGGRVRGRGRKEEHGKQENCTQLPERGCHGCLLTHPSELFSIKFSGIGEDNSTGRHVETQGKCLGSKESLERERERERKKRGEGGAQESTKLHRREKRQLGTCTHV